MPILQLVSIVVALMLGVIVIMRNPADRNRWLLLVFNVSISLWITSYILADTQGDFSLFWNRAVFVSAVGMIFSGYLLVASMADRFGKRALYIGLVFAAWALVILLTPLVVENITPRLSNGILQGFDVIRGSGYIFYVVSLVIAGGSLVGYVFRLSRHAARRFRAQLRIIFAGFGGMLIVGLTLGVLLPLLVGNSEPANYSFMSAFIVMFAFAFSIARQRLFDIRLALARSLGYLLSLVVIVLFYIATIFGIGDLFFDKNGAGLQIYYITTTLIIALTFNRLKQYFNKLTRRVFFRDTYDTQEVFDQLTSFLVRTVELKVVLQGASKILHDAINTDFLDIVLVGREGKYVDLIKLIKKAKEWPIITDDLRQHDGKLVDALDKANVAFISRLQTQHEQVGYIVCGPKIRGDVLTVQDIKLMRVAGGELAVAVQNALRFDEIMHFNQTLTQQIDDATSQLRESNRKLKKLDEAKDEFISMASHQLRTPLTSVKGYISMVLDGDAGGLNPNQSKLLEEAFTSSQRMVYLIGDFLNVSRIQTGRFVLETRPTNLADIVSDEIEQLASTAQRRDIKVRYQPPEDFPMLELDENKIRQVIMNFIDNAIYYSRPGGTVKVSLMNFGNVIRFEVVDSGIGVPENERHKLFTKFFRAENARRVRPDGTGIGLFMAKKVITAHGGNIIFESKENKGSMFGFSLHVPLEKHPEKLVEQVAKS
jgi:signal transduction histidine kinase